MDFKIYQGDYAVFRDGRIQRISTSTQLKTTTSFNQKGYPLVRLVVDGKYRTKTVHRVVAEAWHGDYRKDGYEVDHIDNNRKNNHVDNLRWVSKKENNQKSWDSGNKDNSGIKNGRCRIDPCLVYEICILLEEGLKSSRIRDLIGREYYETIRAIKRRSNWTSISHNFIF